jgi:hypothetical protein
MKRQTRVACVGKYLGEEIVVDLTVRFGQLMSLSVELADDRARVDATLTGQESKSSLVTDCVGHFEMQYEEQQGEPPTELRTEAWHQLFQEAWSKVLL